MARPLKPTTPFGERLIQARGARSRDEVATEIGCPADTLGTYERGRAWPGQTTLIRIAEVLRVSLDWLITGKGEMRPLTPEAVKARLDELEAAGHIRPMPGPAVDEELLARVGEEIVELYRQENGRISQRQLARLQAQFYSDLVAAYDDPAERLVGLKGMIQQLRRDLRTPVAGGDSSKRLA